MNKSAIRLIARGAINKIGNVLYDYGNSIWLASLGGIGQTVLGIYKISETTTSILVNPIAGALVDRFSRKKVLVTTDLLCGILCVLIAFIPSNSVMIAGLIVANIVQAIAFCFSRIANKSYIKEVVAQEEIVTYNARLQTALEVIGVCSPVLSFIVMHYANLRVTLLLDAVTFFVACGLVYQLPDKTPEKREVKPLSVKSILNDIWEGVHYIRREKMVFFLLIVACLVNIFFAAFEYLLPFTDKILGQEGVYATALSCGAVGSIIGALLAGKIPSSVTNLLIAIFLSGGSLICFALPNLCGFPIWIAYVGNLISNLCMVVFNVHFFSQVQTRVAQDYLGRVLSTIYTLAILFMPLSVLIMTVTPSLQAISFVMIACGVMGLAIVSLFYIKNS